MIPLEIVTKIQDMFPNQCSDTNIEELRMWIHNNVDSEQYEHFYNTFKNNYKNRFRYFPTIPDVIEIWKGNKKTGGKIYSRDDIEADCLKATQHYSIPEILVFVKNIRDRSRGRASDFAFIAVWDELAHINGILYDKGWNEIQRLNYLKPIKEAICNDEEIFFNDLKIEEKENSITALSQEDERQEKITQIGELFR